MTVSKWQLVTGQPGCGKTTLVSKLVEILRTQTRARLSGFITEEVRDTSGRRIGFDVVTIPEGQRAALARKDVSGKANSLPKTGAYSVNVEEFEKAVLPCIRPEAGEVVIIDEIGRMELHSQAFKDAVVKLLKSNNYVIGSIAAPRYGHRVPFCDRISNEEKVNAYNITRSNREGMSGKLKQLVLDDLTLQTT